MDEEAKSPGRHLRAAVGAALKRGLKAAARVPPEVTRCACKECPPRRARTFLSLVRALRRPASSRCVVQGLLLGSNLNRVIWPESVWPWPRSVLTGDICLGLVSPSQRGEAGRRDRWEIGRPSRCWEAETLQSPNGPHQAGFCSVGPKPTCQE